MRSYQILLVLFVVGLSVQNQVYLEAVSCAEGCYYQQFAQSCLCADGSVMTPTRNNVAQNSNAATTTQASHLANKTIRVIWRTEDNRPGRKDYSIDSNRTVLDLKFLMGRTFKTHPIYIKLLTFPDRTPLMDHVKIGSYVASYGTETVIYDLQDQSMAPHVHQ